MTLYRSRRKRSSFPKQKRTGRRLSGPRKVKKAEKRKNPLQDPLREFPASRSSVRLQQRERQVSVPEIHRIPGSGRCFSCSEESEKRPIPGGSLSLLDRPLLSSYLSAKIRQYPKLARLREEQFLEVLTITRGGSPTLAALLQFGIYPQGTFPGLCILAEDGMADIQADMQTDVLGLQFAFPDDPSRFGQPERYRNQAEINRSVFPEEPGCSVRIEGMLQEMVRETVIFCRKALNRHGDIREDDNTRNLLSALQKVLWRALLCRDYSACSEHLPIRLSVSSDRIEFRIPVSPETSKPSRNPLLCAMASAMREQERNRDGKNGNDIFDFMSFAPDTFPASGFSLAEFPCPEPGQRGSQVKLTRNPFPKWQESVRDDEWHILLTYGVRNSEGTAGKNREKAIDSQTDSRIVLTGRKTGSGFTVWAGESAAVRKEQKAGSSADRASVQEEILDYCFFPRSRQEIADRIGKKTSQYIIRRYVMPLVEAGKMAMTLPEKPRSKLQRFYTVR